MSNRPKILLSNDDGIQSHGLLLLARELAKIGELTICAPMFERSGASHSLSFNPLHVGQLSLGEEGLNAWVTDGQPADCVKFALSNLFDDPPDLVVSGINAGLNLASHIFYSGTVGAAMEAALLNIPAVAISLGSFGKPPGGSTANGALENATAYSAQLCGKLLEQKLPERVCLNVNFPNIPPAELKGSRLTHHGLYSFDTSYELDEVSGGYRLMGKVAGTRGNRDPNLDWTAIIEGYISLTPLTPDLNSTALNHALSGLTFPPSAG